MGVKIYQSLYVIQKYFSWSLGLEALQTSFNRFLYNRKFDNSEQEEFIRSYEFII